MNKSIKKIMIYIIARINHKRWKIFKNLMKIYLLQIRQIRLKKILISYKIKIELDTIKKKYWIKKKIQISLLNNKTPQRF